MTKYRVDYKTAEGGGSWWTYDWQHVAIVVLEIVGPMAGWDVRVSMEREAVNG